VNIVDGQNLIKSKQATRLLEAEAISSAIVVIEAKRDEGEPFDQLDEKRLRRLGSSLRRIAWEIQHERNQIKDDSLDAIDKDTLKDVATRALEETGEMLWKSIRVLGEVLWAGLRYAFIAAVEVIGDALAMTAAFFLSPEVAIPLTIAVGLGTAAWFGWKAYKDWQGSSPKPSPTPTPSPSMPAAPVALPDNAKSNVKANNPGNIEYHDYLDRYGAYKRPGSRFAGFNTQAQGIYQVSRLLEVYRTEHGVTTIRGIAERYAPATENDTETYIKNLSSWTGYGPDQVLDFSNPAVIAKLTQAIIRQENGTLPYSQDQYDEAAKAAVANVSNWPSVVPVITEPGGAPQVDENAVTASTVAMPTSGKFSSPYGMRRHPIHGVSKMHWGIDIANAKGTPVYAATDGVVYNNTTKGYGNIVTIINKYFVTRYGHLSLFKSINKDRVLQGQLIGLMGSTGDSTGPHLHFEVQPIGVSMPVDPANYLNLPKVNAQSQQQSGSVYLPKTGDTHIVYIDGKLTKVKD
jgi:murein DD-endopeptidase MepM/ murein hydrolase activator NlpD